jgi:hypothetical protein
MTTTNLPAWPTVQSVLAELEEAMDTNKLDGTERRNIIEMVLKAFDNGHLRGIEQMSDAWDKSIKKNYAFKEPTHDAA